MPDDSTELMSAEEFAGKVRAKYPGTYDHLQDQELTSRVLQKYPEYAEKVMAPGVAEARAAMPKMQQIMAPGYEFGKQVATGMGFDANAIDAAQQRGGFGGASSEMGSELLSSLGQFGMRVAKDPFAIADPIESMATALEKGIRQRSPGQVVGAAANIAGGMEGVRASEGVAGKIGKALKPGEPAQRVNDLMGVRAKEIRLGQTPASLDDFATNPGRGLVKYGLDESKLSKLNELERLREITKQRDAVGTQLDNVLKAAGDKTVDISKPISEVFDQIKDERLYKAAEDRLNVILDKAGINKPLNQLSPMEARTIQRLLDNFANFASEGDVKTFKDVAARLRRGISQETRKKVPESAPLDKDYGDLANAVSASKRQATDFARKAPPSVLRELIQKLFIGGTSGSIAGAVAGAVASRNQK